MADPDEHTPPPLTAVDEDWQTALCVVAHPDDMEYGAASAVARWTAQGKKVVYCMVTSGEAGIDGLEPERCREVREAEEIASARVVGVDEVEFLRLPDGVLEYGVALRREICAVVRKHRPDVAVTINHRETFGGTNLNQADHIAVGKALVDAVRDAGNRWVFPEQLDGTGLEKWGGVRGVLVSASPEARHGVDVTDHLAAGVASLEEHRAYIEGLGWDDFDPEEFLEGMARQSGQRLGTRYAVAFELLDTGWGG